VALEDLSDQLKGVMLQERRFGNDKNQSATVGQAN